MVETIYLIVLLYVLWWFMYFHLECYKSNSGLEKNVLSELATMKSMQRMIQDTKAGQKDEMVSYLS